MVEGLKGHKIVDVAVGALHCLAVTDQGQVIKTFHVVHDSGRRGGSVVSASVLRPAGREFEPWFITGTCKRFGASTL